MSLGSSGWCKPFHKLRDVTLTGIMAKFWTLATAGAVVDQCCSITRTTRGAERGQSCRAD
jgi:hypothetical protein